jgi:hypothetical protein
VAESPLQVSYQHANAPDTPSVVEVLQDIAKHAVLKIQDYSKLSFHALANLSSKPR